MAYRKLWYTGNNKLEVFTVDIGWRFEDGKPNWRMNALELELQARHLIQDLYGVSINPLEVSTQSGNPLGVALSPFNLKIDEVPVEVLYHASKVYEDGSRLDISPYTKPWEAKKMAQEKKSKVVRFEYKGQEINGYNFLYGQAVLNYFNNDKDKIKEALGQYDTFTDVCFNPNNGVNCQARVIAALRLLCDRE